MTLESARAAEVLDALARSGQTLAIAESLTGGMLADATASPADTTHPKTPKKPIKMFVF